ncbi:hypothetical protein ABIF23_003396 [Bradyrhizobium elkanii]|uniref:hypothetical protein n=1 Tax=Bradyrhizobium elkanii TaxID=29448 RepID=UPI00351351C7
MIYELRTYTVRPGTVGEMVKAASTISRDIRADNFGKRAGERVLAAHLHGTSRHRRRDGEGCEHDLARYPRRHGDPHMSCAPTRYVQAPSARW